MSAMFAATHPERVTALILYGAMGRTTEAPDYPWASPADALRESAEEFIAPYWGTDAQGTVELFAPSFADDPEAVEFATRMERSAASPGMVRKIFEMFLDMDVRAVLPTIHVPTLVLHRRGDRVVNRRAGEELARQIPGARHVELEGIDHLPWAGDWAAVLGEIEEFLTGARSAPEPDRVLTTVMFTDIVGSTEQAAELGDARWRELLSAHQDAVRLELARSGGREVKTLGDGCLATLDGPARAIRCGQAIVEAAAPRAFGCASACIPARSSWSETTSPASRSTSHHGSERSQPAARCSFRAPSRTLSPAWGSVRRPRYRAAQGHPRPMAAVPR